MDLIPSFQVDHTRIVPGIYVSRIDTFGDAYATTFDVRMKRPNAEPAVHPNALHTIEHIVATYLRNDPVWRNRIVYWGPMGCLTGNYLIVKGRPTPQEIYPLVVAAFEYLRDYTGEVPGATAVNCGNFLLHDLAMAKWEAARFVEALRAHPSFAYPVAERRG
ncbi:MAG: S-ribosylhomocysteine lyase [Kiritimatiellia bacterium]